MTQEEIQRVKDAIIGNLPTKVSFKNYLGILDREGPLTMGEEVICTILMDCVRSAIQETEIDETRVE